MQKTTSIQDVFLNRVRKDSISITVHLVNGFQIKGRVRAFDSFVILLETEAKQQMVLYKHAVSSLTPAERVSFGAAENSSEKAEELEQ